MSDGILVWCDICCGIEAGGICCCWCCCGGGGTMDGGGIESATWATGDVECESGIDDGCPLNTALADDVERVLLNIRFAFGVASLSERRARLLDLSRIWCLPSISHVTSRIEGRLEDGGG